MLVYLLREHPDVLSHGEVFSPRIVGLGGPLAVRCLDHLEALEELHRIRASAPETFLYDFILDPHGRRAVGFKLKYDELIREDYRRIRDIVAADRDLKILFLERENLFERYVSYHVVNAITSVPVVFDSQEPPRVPRFTVDAAACHADMQEIERRTAAFEQVFAEHPSIRVTYETLVADPVGEMARVFGFLGVQARKVAPRTRKILRGGPQDLVENYEELRHYFSRTRYAAFFKD